MESAIRYGGWVVALVLLAVVGYLYSAVNLQKGRSIAAESAAVEAQDVTLQKIELAEKRALDAEGEVASFRDELDRLRAELAEASGKSVANEADDQPLPEEPDMDEAPAETEEESPSRTDRIVDAQMGIVADMAYQDLYAELGLTPEEKEQLRGMIANHLSKSQRATVAAMQSKSKTAKEFHAEQEQLDAELRATLEGFLTPEELAAWDEYEPVADQIMYERLVEGQLNMMASGLSGDNRIHASQVMAEELVREFDMFNASDQTYSMDNFNDAQARALSASLERLQPGMEEEQYAQVEGFVNQAMAMFDAMREGGAAQ